MEINRSGMIGGNKNNEFKAAKKSLGMDDFLQIMAAEIKNQNPMGSEGGGGGNTDYISQLAQFTTLEQMAEITEGINMLTLMNQQQHSFNLIGKKVTLSLNDEKITGLVEKVKFDKGYAMLVVNNEEYPLGAVLEVGVNHEL